jgi:hypothetical protein
MKKLYVTFLVLVLALAMIVPVGVVNAGSGQVEVEGEITFVWNGYIVIEKVVGNTGITEGEMGRDVCYTGDIVGNADELLTFVMNPSTGEWPNFMVNSKGTQVFTGTVLGYEGTFTANVRHQMKLDGSGKVEQTIVSGTGDLNNLHGTLIFTIYRQVDGSYSGTYSGKLHFAP